MYESESSSSSKSRLPITRGEGRYLQFLMARVPSLRTLFGNVNKVRHLPIQEAGHRLVVDGEVPRDVGHAARDASVVFEAAEAHQGDVLLVLGAELAPRPLWKDWERLVRQLFGLSNHIDQCTNVLLTKNLSLK